MYLALNEVEKYAIINQMFETEYTVKQLNKQPKFIKKNEKFIKGNSIKGRKNRGVIKAS